MPVRIKKLVGTVILVFLVIVYAIFATAFASAYLGEAHWTVHLIYFLLTGLLWIVPAMVLISWMERQPRP